MRILVTAAEQQEIDCALRGYEATRHLWKNDVEMVFRLTGIGATNACYCVTKEIVGANAAGNPYDLVINMGIAGSYDLNKYPIGSAAVISREIFGDLGFEGKDGFEDLFRYGILNKDTFPYTNGALARQLLPYRNIEEALGKYGAATGVTVQRITGSASTTEELVRLYSPHIESMEGAAVYYACLMEKVPFFGLRTVSNAIGERDTRKWDTPAALDALQECCHEIFSVL